MDLNVMLIAFVVIMGLQLFLGIKRQKKHAQEAKKMMDDLVPGAHVITIGGLHGVVFELHDNTVVIDCEGVYLTFERASIARVFAPKVAQVADLYPTENVQNIVTDLSENSDTE